MKFNKKELNELMTIRQMRSLSKADGVVMLPAADLKMLLETLDLFCNEMDRICGLAEPEVKLKELN